MKISDSKWSLRTNKEFILICIDQVSGALIWILSSLKKLDQILVTMSQFRAEHFSTVLLTTPYTSRIPSQNMENVNKQRDITLSDMSLSLLIWKSTYDMCKSHLCNGVLIHSVSADLFVNVQQSIKVSSTTIQQLIWYIRVWAQHRPLKLKKPDGETQQSLHEAGVRIKHRFVFHLSHGG